jgi:hypothetical protein
VADLWKTTSPRGLGAGHVDDRGHGVGAGAKGSATERRRAARYVAGVVSAGRRDAALLLSMLGLEAVEGRDGTAA